MSDKTVEITRLAAIKSLISILYNGKSSGSEISHLAKIYSLTNRDRQFFARIVYGTLKNLSLLDHILRKLLHSGKFPSKAASMALRVGGYQIAFADVPAYAAVDSTVEALRTFGANPGEIALTNAVLKKFCAHWRDIKLPEDKLKRLAILYSHPRWIVKRWLERYGADITAQMLAANNDDPPKYFRINTIKTTPADFKRMMVSQGFTIADCVFDEYFELIDGISPFDFSPLRDGFCTVQDAAFAIPTKLLNPQCGERILEIGAAPGGKSTHIAETLHGITETLFLLDIYHGRNSMLRENFNRLNISIPNIITGNGVSAPFKPNTFDKVLIDAPCTSWGVIRRHPEIRWHRKPEDEIRLAKLQGLLIDGAYKVLKRGGILLFATCTTEPEENQGAVQNMLANNMQILRLKNISKVFAEADGRIARTWTYRDNMDGAFSVMARKT